MDSLPERLAQIESASATSRPAQYSQVLSQLLSSPRSELPSEAFLTAANTYLDRAVFSDANSTGGGLVVGRQVLAEFEKAVEAATKVEKDGMEDDGPQVPAVKDPDVRRQILEDALEKVQPKVLSFEEQASALREQLASLLEAEEDWASAARVLQGIPLDSGHRSTSNVYKLRTYMRIVRLLLEADDAVSADVFLKRAALIIHLVPPTPPASGAPPDYNADEAKVLHLHFKLCQARIYDAGRRFPEAAIRYHELSYVAEIDEEERTHMLGAAVTAAVLSPAGPHRSRILSTLIRDERTASLPQHTILSKVFLDHIIRPAEIEAFEKLLAPHQVAKLPPSGNEKAMLAAAEKASASAGAGAEDAAIGEADSEPVCTRSGPSTVLDRAMMEHNVLAASRLYNNITLRGLGALLDLSPAGAETMARRMISQRRLRAEIDQVDGIITFLDDGRLGMHEGGTAGGLGAGTGATADALAAAAGGDQDERAMVDDPDTSYTRRWDAQIARTAGELESICQRLTKEGLLPPAQAVV